MKPRRPPRSSQPVEGDYTVRVIDALKQVPREDWDALLPADRPGTPFLSWDFLQALEEAGCAAPAQGWLPMHLTVWRDDVLLAGAPAYLKGNSNGEFVFDWAWADLAQRLGRPYYPKLILAVPFTPVTGARLLVRPDVPAAEQPVLRGVLLSAARTLSQQVGLSSVHVLFPQEAEAEALIGAGLARRVGVQFHWRNDGYRDFDDFLSRFSAKRRHMMRRERAEVRRAGFTVRTARGRLSESEVAAMYRFYVSTVDKFFYGQRYLNERFFQLLAERMPGTLEFVQARAGSGPDARLVAGAINLADGDRLYGRYWGQLEGEEHRFLHFEVCYYHSIEECITRGFTAFEPGAGGEHKLSRGFEPTLTYSAHDLLDGDLDRPVRAFLQREERAVRERVAAEAQTPRQGGARAGD